LVLSEKVDRIKLSVIQQIKSILYIQFITDFGVY